MATFKALLEAALGPMNEYLAANKKQLEEDLDSGIAPRVAAANSKARIAALTCPAICQKAYCECMRRAGNDEAAKTACADTLQRCLAQCPTE